MSRLPDVLRDQARHCVALDSPFMGDLLTGLADHWPTGTRLADAFDRWPADDIGPAGASLPLRLAGGLHALVLSNRAPDLAAHYPPNQWDPSALCTAALQAMQDHADFLLDWAQNAPQTNEVRRSVALIPVAHLLSDRFNLPLKLSELGASGGLNLMFDHFALRLNDSLYAPASPIFTLTPDWTGPLPPRADLRVAERRGADLNPLDPSTPSDALRLLAYLWPDQSERLARTRAAISVTPAHVDRADAADWIDTRLSAPAPDHCHLIFHTIAWQYFPPPVQARAKAAIEQAGAWATETAPLAWLSMENDGQFKGAALTLRLWPGDITLDLGRADFHGRWVDWQGPDRLP